MLLLGLFVRDHAFSLYDDAFIYLRYVRNLHAGCGFRFNCDESPVEAFSGPLWLSFLLLASLATSNLVAATQVIGTVAIGGALVAAVVAATQTYGPLRLTSFQRGAAACAVAVVLACDPFVLLNAVIGLETGLAALVVVLLLMAVRADNRKLAVALACAMTLIRPEGALFVVGLFLLPWARTWRVAAFCVAFLVTMTLARYAIFGDVVANTVWAKSGGTWKHAVLGASYIVSVVQDFPAILAAPLLLALSRARADAAYFLIVTAAWFGSFLYSGGDTFAYSRFAFPLVPALVVLSVQGVLAAADRRARKTDKNWAAVLAVLPFAFVAARAAVSHNLAPSHGFPNVALWTAVGEHLKAQHPGMSVATVPIGAIGYYSEAKLLDLVGLASR